MTFLRRQHKRTEALVQVQAMSDDDENRSGGLMTGVEKGFFEATLFTFSMILHLLHSLKEEHGARS